MNAHLVPSLIVPIYQMKIGGFGSLNYNSTFIHLCCECYSSLVILSVKKCTMLLFNWIETSLLTDSFFLFRRHLLDTTDQRSQATA